MKNKRIYIVMLTLIMVFAAGCTGKPLAQDDKEPEVKVTEEVEEEIVEEEEEEVEDEDIEEEEIEVEESEEVLEEFKIYSADIDTYEPEVMEETNIKSSLGLEDKINMLADKISEEQFANLDIELLEIDSDNIATINLIDDKDLEITWERDFFQGSTGGMLTTTALQETFLQSDYDGEWIDGVKFLYNNEIIIFDHVESLSEVKRR